MADASLEVGGLRIAVHRWGDGPQTVLCLASTGLSGLQWRRLGKLLSKRGMTVLAPDLIGYGESDDWPGPEPFTTARDVEVAAAVLAGCPGPVHLVGHSYGGRVGLRLGLLHPDRLRSLALFEPTCFGVLRSSGDTIGVGELEAYDADGRFLADDFGGSEAWLARFVDYWSGAGTWAELDDVTRAPWLRSRRKIFEEVRETALDDLPHRDYVTALGHLPLLLLSGRESTLAGQRCCEVLAQVWGPGPARHHSLPDVGHMAPVLAAGEVASRIGEFISTT